MGVPRCPYPGARRVVGNHPNVQPEPWRVFEFLSQANSPTIERELSSTWGCDIDGKNHPESFAPAMWKDKQVQFEFKVDLGETEGNPFFK